MQIVRRLFLAFRCIFYRAVSYWKRREIYGRTHSCWRRSTLSGSIRLFFTLKFILMMLIYPENRLQRLKDPNSAANSKTSKLLSDLSSARDHQLFHLLTDPTSKLEKNRFENNFEPIESNWIQRKIAPQTCAINEEEKRRLLKHDELEVGFGETSYCTFYLGPDPSTIKRTDYWGSSPRSWSREERSTGRRKLRFRTRTADRNSWRHV